MKKIVAAFLCTLVSFSCKKENEDTPSALIPQNPTDSISHDNKWQSYNDYIPFPEGDAVWYTESTLPIWNGGQVNPNQPPDTLYTFENKIYISGDSIINNTIYKKVIRYYEYKKYDFNPSSPPGYLVKEDNNRELHGCFRQDVFNKHVFFVEPNTQSEVLLYDFGLSIGDTSEIYSNAISIYTLHCIDSVKLSNRFHKAYSYQVENRDGSGSKFINTNASIEGIGSPINGPFHHSGMVKEFSFEQRVIYNRMTNRSRCD